MAKPLTLNMYFLNIDISPELHEASATNSMLSIEQYFTANCFAAIPPSFTQIKGEDLWISEDVFSLTLSDNLKYQLIWKQL